MKDELKGLKAYFNTNIKGLSYPLMALIDFKGYRLVASLLLPLQFNSLIYGSENGGKQINKKNRQLNDLMKESAKLLNLSPHLCGTEKEIMYSAVDLEGFLLNHFSQFIYNKKKVMLEKMEGFIYWISAELFHPKNQILNFVVLTYTGC